MRFQEEPYPGYITTVAYQLPANLTCRHCVLQWWLFTGNSCNHVGYREYQGVHCDSEWYNKELQDCQTSDVKPEEFWNCADISIKRKCKSIDPDIPDKWCQNVNCDDAYFEYCEREYI